MISINLLPYRNRKNERCRQRFLLVLTAVVLLGALTGWLGNLVVLNILESQKARNAFLSKELLGLDREIADIRQLKSQADGLLSRKEIIESLQLDRSFAVKFMVHLAQAIPVGIVLQEVKQKGQALTLSGMTQSGARVSVLLRNLDLSEFFEKPVLLFIRSSVQATSASQFSVSAQISDDFQQGAHQDTDKRLEVR